MTPAETLLAATIFATIITVIVNGIISAYDIEGDDENVD